MKEYIKSALITFFAGVIIVVMPEIEHLTIADLTNGTLAGILFAAVRTGLKMVFELYLVRFHQK